MPVMKNEMHKARNVPTLLVLDRFELAGMMARCPVWLYVYVVGVGLLEPMLSLVEYL
jgi:hypothetical protein